MLVVVTITGVLASLALPAYTDYLRRGRIPAATAHLSMQRARMEQHFQDRRSYADAPFCTSATATVAANNTDQSDHFAFTCNVTLNGSGYQLTATGVRSMVGFVYTVTQSNARSSRVPSNWALPTPNNCWAVRNGAC